MNLSITQYLPSNIRLQLEDFISQIQASWSVEHESDGTHKKVSGAGNIVIGGYGTFQGQLRCQVLRASNQAIANTTPTVLQFDAPIRTDVASAEDSYDNGSVASSGPIYQRGVFSFIPPEGGNYLFIASTQWEANATGKRSLRIRSGTELIMEHVREGHATVTVTQQIMGIVPFPPRDSMSGALAAKPVTIEVEQSSGGALNALAAGVKCQVLKLS